MARLIDKRLSKKDEERVSRELLREFKAVDSFGKLNDFFKKFMTDSEREIIFRRVAAIEMIGQKKKYKEIREALNISKNTISKSKDILEGRGYGRNPDRKRRYSTMASNKKNKNKSILPKYKGARSII
ncbi:MAG: hypothetical protein HZA37_02110 [Parcubacteria group bacterium]|nr:hypothetical protein [Parcubacteria group bacterium]